MKFLLDTNICIYIINNRPPEVRAIFERRPAKDSSVSVVTMLELKVGAFKRGLPDARLALIDKFTSPMARLDFDDDDASLAAQLRASLELGGQMIGPYDLLIAAQALNHDLILVTNNEREFRRVPGLKIENWITDKK